MSSCVVPPGVMVTGRVPIGAIFWPLTVLGVTREGSRLSVWSPSSCTMSVPATEISAPESGRALTVAEPLGFDTRTAILGAESMCWGRAVEALTVLGTGVGTDTA